MKMNFLCAKAGGKGPRMSIPHCASDQDTAIGLYLAGDLDGMH